MDEYKLEWEKSSALNSQANFRLEVGMCEFDNNMLLVTKCSFMNMSVQDSSDFVGSPIGRIKKVYGILGNLLEDGDLGYRSFESLPGYQETLVHQGFCPAFECISTMCFLPFS